MFGSYKVLLLIAMVDFTMSFITVTKAELNNFNNWRNLGEHQGSSKELINEFDYGSSNSEMSLTDKIHILFEKLKSSSFPTAVTNLTNQKCVNDSLLYVHTLYSSGGSNASWARQMYESSGDYLPLGFFGGSGNLHSDGLFDECLAVKGPKEANFRGKYCSVFLSLTLVNESEIIPVQEDKSSMVTIFQLINQIFDGAAGRVEPKVSNATPFSNAYPSTIFCLPSSCTADDLGQAVAQLIGTNVIGNYSILTTTDENYCFTNTKSPPSFDGPDIAVVVTLSFIGLLVLCATAQEAWRLFNGTSFDYESDGIIVNILQCFSLLKNVRKFLSMRLNPGEGYLGCLHGIRVLSTLWVVIGHTWIQMSMSSPNVNSVKEDGMSWWFQGIGNPTVAVDNFYFMSGLLVCYHLLKELDRSKGKFNVCLFYLHRYLRLTPVYAIVLGFVATLMVYVGSGPNWFKVVSASNSCRVAWWKHFLYIQNLWPTDVGENCMAQTWYLAADMQLFIIAPLIVYLLWRSPFIGLLSIMLTNIASITANIFVFSLVFLQPTIMFTRQAELVKVGTNNDYYYDLPWTRAPPYVLGIYMGWFLKTTEDSSNRPMPKFAIILNWIVTVGVFGAIIFGLVPYLDERKVPEIPLGVTISYGAFHRTAWASFLGWVVFACARGYGGVSANRLLSYKGFVPLSRLTYCVYLIHLDYINVYFAWNRKQLYYTFMGTLTTYFGIVVSVFGLAFLLSGTIEASILNLEKLIFKRGETRILMEF